MSLLILSLSMFVVSGSIAMLTGRQTALFVVERARFIVSKVPRAAELSMEDRALYAGFGSFFGFVAGGLVAAFACQTGQAITILAITLGAALAGVGSFAAVLLLAVGCACFLHLSGRVKRALSGLHKPAISANS